ncbi:MAG: hypothetical protein AAGC86_11570 [Pseudomonadota bacterium]
MLRAGKKIEAALTIDRRQKIRLVRGAEWTRRARAKQQRTGAKRIAKMGKHRFRQEGDQHHGRPEPLPEADHIHSRAAHRQTRQWRARFREKILQRE